MKYYIRIALFAALFLPLFIANSICNDYFEDFASDVKFFENKGQIRANGEQIMFYATSPACDVYFRKGGVSYVFKLYNPETKSLTSRRVDADFAGASAEAAILAKNPESGVFNFYNENVPNGIAGVKSYSKIIYRELYPGVDLVFKSVSAKNKIKYDFIVRPDGDINDIKIKYSGVESIKLTENGIVEVDAGVGAIFDNIPKSYIGNEIENILVEAKFVLKNKSLSFEAGEYDKTKTLTIDPEIIWSTYFGGSHGDHPYNLEIDSENNIIICGNTLSKDFPATAGAYQTTRAGFYDAFVAKFDDRGNMLWTTYYGGEESDFCSGLSIGPNDELSAVGWTWSEYFPTSAGAHQESFFGGDNDGFIFQLDKDGLRNWSTYFGGEANEHLYDIDSDELGNVVITGWTESASFHVDESAFQPDTSGKLDAFVTLMDAQGQKIWNTYFGGDSSDAGQSVYFDNFGDIIVCGYSESPNIPIVSSDEKDLPHGVHDVFLAKFRSSGTISNILWSKMIGGSGKDFGYCMTLDEDSNIYITGSTESADFPATPDALQKTYGGLSDGFAVKCEPSGSVTYATYYGGSGEDICYGVGIDSERNILITGITSSADLPNVAGSFQDEFGGVTDAFAAKISADGSRYYWSTYIGGNLNEWSHAIRAGAGLNVYVAGATESENFPVAGDPFQDEFAGVIDGFLMKLCPTQPHPSIEPYGAASLCRGDSIEIRASATNIGHWKYEWSTGDTTTSITVKESGVYRVSVEDDYGCSGVSETLEVIINELPEPEISGVLEFCENDSTTLDAGEGYIEYKWSTGDTTRYITANEEGRYECEIVDSNGCEGSAYVDVEVNPLPQPEISGRTSVCAFAKNVEYYINGPNGHDYQWEISGGEIISGQGTRSLFVDWGDSGFDTVKVAQTNPGTGCSNDAEPLIVEIADELKPKIESSTGKFYLCEGDSIILDAGEGYATYFWRTGERRQTLKIGTPGIYSVQVSDTDGCEGSDTVEVYFVETPALEISGDARACAFSTAIYNAENVSGYSYTWTCEGGEIKAEQGFSTTISWGGSGEGRVFLTARADSAGCEVEAAPFEVEIIKSPEPSIASEDELSFCEGDSATLDAGDGCDSYLWNNGATTRRITVFDAGEYIVEVDSAGCNGSASVEIEVFPAPPKPQISIIGNALESTAAFSYQWLYRGAPVADANKRNFEPKQTGYYRVEIFDENGCSNISDEVYFEVPDSAKPYALVAVEDSIFAEPGEIFQIKLYLIESRDLAEVGANSFRAHIRFNRTVMTPVADLPGFLVEPNEISVEISGVRRIETGLLHSEDFYAALGDSICSEVGLDSLFWNVEGVQTVLQSGVYCMKNLCFTYGSARRVFRAGESLKLEQNKPNPFSDKTAIVFSTPENGETKIILSNMLGETVAIIFDENAKAGTRTAFFDAANIPSGIYYYTLSTPSGRLTKILNIVK